MQRSEIAVNGEQHIDPIVLDQQLHFNKMQAEVAAKWWLFLVNEDLTKIISVLNKQITLAPIHVSTEQEEIFLATLADLIWEACQDPILSIRGQQALRVGYDFAKNAMNKANIQVSHDEHVSNLFAFVYQDGTVTYQHGYRVGLLYDPVTKFVDTTFISNATSYADLNNDVNDVSLSDSSDANEVLISEPQAIITDAEEDEKVNDESQENLAYSGFESLITTDNSTETTSSVVEKNQDEGVVDLVAVNLTSDDKYFIINMLHNEYISDVLIEIQLKRSIKSLQFDDVIADQTNLKSIYEKLQGLEMIKQLRAKKENIQRTIRRYVEDVIQATKIRNDEYFSSIYASLIANVGTAASISCLSYIVNMKSYPDNGLDNILLDVGDSRVVQQLRGIAILLNLSEQTLVLLPDISEQVVHLEQAIYDKIQEATAARKSTKAPANFAEELKNLPPRERFAYFFGVKQPEQTSAQAVSPEEIFRNFFGSIGEKR